MSKTKGIKMTLGEFNQHVEQQQQKQRSRTRRMPARPVSQDRGARSGGRLSDRLKARQSNASSDRGRGRGRADRPARSAARVVAKPAVESKAPSFNDSTFPALVDNIQIQVQGSWAQGIQAIRDAKDLPDPVKVREQELREQKLRARQARNARYARDRYDSYSDSEGRDADYYHPGSGSGSEYTDDEEPEQTRQATGSGSDLPVEQDPLAPVYYSDEDWDEL